MSARAAFFAAATCEALASNFDLEKVQEVAQQVHTPLITIPELMAAGAVTLVGGYDLFFDKENPHGHDFVPYAIGLIIPPALVAAGSMMLSDAFLHAKAPEPDHPPTDCVEICKIPAYMFKQRSTKELILK